MLGYSKEVKLGYIVLNVRTDKIMIVYSKRQYHLLLMKKLLMRHEISAVKSELF